jgi:quinolinate synthase
LQKEKEALVLAHYYQDPEIQDIADFVGDSLELSRKAAETNANMIVFAGVYFMAETAKILNPDKKVVIPDLNAGCSLADSCPVSAFKSFIEQHPDHTIVTYINCSAEIKALSDLVCTSSNAVAIINSIPDNKQIIFAPDKNLGKYLIKTTGRNMLLWEGSCIVHEAFSFEKLLTLSKIHPNAEIIAHPECEETILEVATFIGSTKAMIRYVKNSTSMDFIVGTEAGILHKMQQEVPLKTLIPAPSIDDNSCACSECGNMKVNTMQKLYDCLNNESPEILVPDEIVKDALIPINHMLQLS